MNSLPSPRAKLADCLWLPRIIAKARALHAGELPADYVERFCNPVAVDGHFLQFFGLSKEDLLAAAERFPTDEEIATWFHALPGMDAKRIAEWNELAGNLGRSGYPMAERFKATLATIYSDFNPATVHSIFDLIETDENPGDSKGP
jgi:hypothetical protein